MLLLLGSFRLFSRRRDLSKVAEEVVTLRDRDRESLVGALLLVTLPGEVVACFLWHRSSSLVVMAGPLDESWAKLERAHFHVDALTADIKNVLKADGKPAWTIAKKYEPENSRFAITVGTVIPFPLDRWGVILGDALHNFRSALDYLAWVLVTQANGGVEPSEPVASQVSFPIWDEAPLDSGHRSQRFNFRLPGLPDWQWTMVERYQPYTRGDTAKRHPLSLLRTFCDHDKHRRINVTRPRNAEVTIKATYASARDCTLDRIESASTGEILEVGTPIGWVYVKPIGPKPYVRVKCESFTTPKFENGEWVSHTLDRIGVMILEVLREFEPIL